jgi:phosphate/sulfate permease
LELEAIVTWFVSAGIGGIIGSLLTVAAEHYFEEKKSKRDQRVADLKERLGKLWHLLFYFGNMRSWGEFTTGAKDKASYAFATEVLARYLGEMTTIMQSETWHVGLGVRNLWFEWQPYAVAAVERRRGKIAYPRFSEAEFLERTGRLHDALTADYKELVNQSTAEISH